MNLLIMGLPGAGKGTQAAKIVEEFGVAHISTGDMFRAAMANQTEMGRLAKSFIDKRLAESDIAEKGFLLDGYPRTIEQAHALDETLKALDIKLDGVINIEVNPESLVERLSGRFICRSCGSTYHKVFNPTKVEGTCDVCGGHEFFQREDDKPETVKRRLDVNIAQGEPIIAHYRELGLVSDIQGNQDIDDVFADVKKAIAAIK